MTTLDEWRHELVLGARGSEPLRHYTDGRGECFAPDGFDVSVVRWQETELPEDDYRLRTTLHGLRLACRTCGHYDRFTDLTEATVYDDGSQHRVGRVAWAGHPALKAGPLLLSPDRTFSHGRDVFEFLALHQGTVVGSVALYHTQRLTRRYRWAVLGEHAAALELGREEGRGDGFSSPAAAGRALARFLAL